MSDKPVACVTGASSGIGWQTALAFAARGYGVTLAARRRERMEELADLCRQAGGEPLVAPTDVAEAAQVQAMADRTLEQFGRLDVLVNNAGYGMFERVHEIDEAALRRIFDVNFFGLWYGCKAVAPIMIRQRRGHIFNVSSVIGRRGTPFHGAYCATKFAVIGLTDSMRVELRPYGIRVTAVLPALTDTEFFQQSVRGQKAQSSFQKFKRLTPPHAVARKIVASVGRNKPELVFTLGGKLLVLLSALSPRLTDKMMQAYFADLVKKLG